MAVDVFISYASEDREKVAKPLAELLSQWGVSVWFDQFSLKIGDSLRRHIDQGLATCKFGIVVLSPAFFAKHYPNRELDGLAQREVSGEKVILPIWVAVTQVEVCKFSPPLADRVAGQWTDGLEFVAFKLLEVVKPDVVGSMKKRLIALSRLRTGAEIVDLVIGSHFSYEHHEEPKNELEVNMIGEIVQRLRDLADIWDDIEAPDQMRETFALSEKIKELEANGWSIYGARVTGKKKLTGVESMWTWNIVATMRGEPARVWALDGKVYSFRPTA